MSRFTLDYYNRLIAGYREKPDKSSDGKSSHRICLEIVRQLEKFLPTVTVNEMRFIMQIRDLPHGIPGVIYRAVNDCSSYHKALTDIKPGGAVPKTVL